MAGAKCAMIEEREMLPLPSSSPPSQIYEPNNRCPFAWPIKCRHFMPLNGNGNIGHCNAVGGSVAGTLNGRVWQVASVGKCGKCIMTSFLMRHVHNNFNALPKGAINSSTASRSAASKLLSNWLLQPVTSQRTCPACHTWWLH